MEKSVIDDDKFELETKDEHFNWSKEIDESFLY